MDEKNILIKISTDTSQVGEAAADLQSLQDRERDIQMEMRKGAAEYQKQVFNIQATVKGREQQIAALEKLRASQDKNQRSLDAELNKTKTSLASLNDRLKAVNDTVAKGAAQQVTLRTQLKNVREEMSRLEMSGVSPTDKAFMKLAVSAGRLQDQMGDTQRRIQILASDTRGLDAAMSVGTGLAGGFNIATSAAALLGGENEELAKAFHKVQAVMAIMNGVQQVANMLNKDSAARVVISNAVLGSNTIERVKNYAATKVQTASQAIETAVQGKGTIARGAATASQWALNAAMYAFPLIALIAGLAALGVGIFKLISANKQAKQTQQEFNDTLDTTSRLMEQLKNDTEFYASIASAEGKSAKEILDIKKKAAQDSLTIADEGYERALELYNSADKKTRKKLKEGLDEANEVRKRAWSEVNKLNQEGVVLELTQQTAANQKRKEETEKAYKERIASTERDAQQRKAQIVKAGEDLEQLTITMMEDGAEKDRLQIELDFNKRLQQIVGNSDIEIQLRKKLEEQKGVALANIVAKYAKLEADERVKIKKEAEDKIKQENENASKEWLKNLDQQHQLGKIETDKYLDAKLAYLIQSNASEEAINEAQFQKELQQVKDKDKADDEANERKKARYQELVNFISQLGDALFQHQQNQLAQELSDLEHFYTTDAKEAAENADKKYISEKELERKKLEIKRKQARIDKTQALFQIAIDTAVAAIGALKTDPLGILSGIIIASGLLAAATVASKPLPAYAKGKKSGDGSGSMAKVGEYGAEFMYVPENAAIMPHDKTRYGVTRADLASFGIPFLDTPDVDSRWIQRDNSRIDYDRVGASIAKHMNFPNIKQAPVTVNVDKNGVRVQNGTTTTTYLNKKYSGQWT